MCIDFTPPPVCVQREKLFLIYYNNDNNGYVMATDFDKLNLLHIWYTYFIQQKSLVFKIISTTIDTTLS